MAFDTLKIFYIGNLIKGGTCRQRMEAAQELGCNVVGMDVRVAYPTNPLRRLLKRARRRLFFDLADSSSNRKILASIGDIAPDIVWIDKGLSICPGTLAEIKRKRPQCKVVGYSPDDMMNNGNQSRQIIGCLPLYDVFFTTKSYNVAELEEMGCQKTVFVQNAFDPRLHRPVELSKEERAKLGGPVGFIGSFEQERASSIAFLAQNGIPVKVWGDHWDKWHAKTGKCFDLGGPCEYGDNYAKILCSFDISLCFLRKVNRDLQTTRSIEIPACGTFMLAERTDEHLQLFEEGEEAEFFGSDEELLRKVRYYLANPDKRSQVAARGRERCLRDGYSNTAQIEKMLKIVMSLD